MALVASSLNRTHGSAEFRVKPLVEGIGETLVAMGFVRRAADFCRVFADSTDVPRIFTNFSRHIDEMILFKQRARPAPWQEALRAVIAGLSDRLDWWLTGSAALAVRGIDVAPRDIDLVVADAQMAGEAFADVLVEPVAAMTGWIADWFGRAFIGSLIEWVAGVHADVDDPGPHEQGPIAAARREVVTWQGHRIVCAPLDLHLAVAQARGLVNEVEAINRFIERSM